MATFFILLLVILEMHCSSSTLHKLPGNIRPSFYELDLKIDSSGAKTYSGSVKITIRCQEETNSIVLHANLKMGLTVTEESVEVYYEELGDETEKNLNVADFKYNEEHETISIKLEENMLSGKDYFIEISFIGIISNSLAGLFEVNDQGKYFIASNFKRTYARNVFPCFDEPSMRAKFLIKIERRTEAKTYCSAKLVAEHESKEAGWQVDVYEQPINIAPYQVAFIVTELPVKKWEKTNGYCSVTLIQQSDHCCRARDIYNINSAVEAFTSKMTLPGIENMKLQKLEYVLLPGPAEISVETIGLVLKSEFDFDSSRWHGKDYKDYLTKESVMKQWLISNVPSDTWESQWLISCLARYFAVKQISDQFYVAEILPQMFSVWTWDSRRGSKSLSHVGKTKDTIEQEDPPEKMEKGLMLLMMLDSIFGSDNFLKSVQRFVTIYQHSKLDFLEPDSDVYSKHFWLCFDLHTKAVDGFIPLFTTEVELVPGTISTQQIVDSWINKNGYPIITVTRKGKNVVEVSQKRFFGEKNPPEPTEGDYWCVPLTYTTAANKADFESTRVKAWLGCSYEDEDYITTTVYLGDNVNKHHWVVFNNQMTGLYRVNYDEKNWELIAETLNDRRKMLHIHVINRAQIVNDVLILSYLGEVNFYIAFQIAYYLRYEFGANSFIVWEAFFSGVDQFRQTLKGSKIIQDQLNVFVRNTLEQAYYKSFRSKEEVNKYIDEEKSDEEFFMKLLIHEESCMAKLPSCVFHSRELFNDWKNVDFDIEPKPNVVWKWIFGENKKKKHQAPSRLKYHRKSRKSLSKGFILSVMCTTVNVAETTTEVNYIIEKLDYPGNEKIDRHLYVDALKCAGHSITIDRVLSWCTTTTVNENMKEKVEIFKGLLSNGDSLLQAGNFLYNNFDSIELFTLGENKEDHLIHELIEIMACEMSPDHLIELFKTNHHTTEKIQAILASKDIKPCEKDHQWVKENAELLKEALIKVAPKDRTV